MKFHIDRIISRSTVSYLVSAAVTMTASVLLVLKSDRYCVFRSYKHRSLTMNIDFCITISEITIKMLQIQRYIVLYTSFIILTYSLHRDPKENVSALDIYVPACFACSSSFLSIGLYSVYTFRCTLPCNNSYS